MGINNGLILNWIKHKGIDTWGTIEVTLPKAFTQNLYAAFIGYISKNWDTSTTNTSDRQISQHLQINLVDVTKIKIGNRYDTLVGCIGY